MDKNLKALIASVNDPQIRLPLQDASVHAGFFMPSLAGFCPACRKRHGDSLCSEAVR